MIPLFPKKKNLIKFDFFILIVIGLIIGLSLYFVGGLTPGKNFRLTAYSDKQGYIPVNPEVNSDSEQGLQIDLIKLKGCSSTAAVNFLVDRSGSMGMDGGKKIQNLRNAILSFKNKLSDDNIIGLQAYSQEGIGWNGLCNPQGPWCNLINPTYYKDVRDTIHNTVCRITANGGTMTRDAFLLTEKVLDETKQKYPNHKLNLIFISDGIPEDDTNNLCNFGTGGEEYKIGGQWCGTNPDSGTCRCYSKKQDPTNFYDPSTVDVPKRIKDKGIRIFTISYVDHSDSHLNGLLQSLMQRVASNPDDYYRSPSESDIKLILDEIAVKICKEV